jgi:hypothetical protein
MRWIVCDGFDVGVRELEGRIQVHTVPRLAEFRVDPGQARALAIELMALAEKLDPQPPPRPRPDSGRQRRRP